MLNAFSYSENYPCTPWPTAPGRCNPLTFLPRLSTGPKETSALNRLESDRHEGIVEDVTRFFNQTELQYDVVVVDPPAFAKSIAKRHNAVQAYKRLNLAAMKCLRPGGILFHFFLLAGGRQGAVLQHHRRRCHRGRAARSG